MHRVVSLPFVIASLVVSVWLLPATAVAQPNNCAPRAVVVEQLNTKYGEVRKSVGLAANNGMVEVFASDTTGSWTITLTKPNGITCLVASGQSYETVEEVLPTSAQAL